MQRNFEEILEELIENYLEQGHGDMAEVYLALSAMLERYHSIVYLALSETIGGAQENCFELKRKSLWNRLKNLLKIK